jgi:hypothetical protein
LFKFDDFQCEAGTEDLSLEDTESVEELTQPNEDSEMIRDFNELKQLEIDVKSATNSELHSKITKFNDEGKEKAVNVIEAELNRRRDYPDEIDALLHD